MSTRKIISDVRTKKYWTQSDLAVKVLRVMIDKYECNETILSIEVPIKIPQTFEESFDYLAWERISASFDKRSKEPIHEIENLSPTTSKTCFFIDTFPRDTKAQKAYA